VPIPRGKPGHYMFIREDLFDSVGAAKNPQSYDEFLDAAKKLTNPGNSGDEMIRSSVKIGVVHGLLNTVAFGVSGYAWYSRIGSPAFAPGRLGIWLSVLTLPGVALSAALGGELVYGKGVGVQRMGYARDEKVAGLKEHEAKAA